MAPQAKPKKRKPPATTLEARENQMIALAVDLAEQQLRDGTASSQIITEFIRRGSTKERIEKEILAEQKNLIKAKVKAIQSGEDIKELYLDALKAMKTYTGSLGGDEFD